MDPSQMYTGSGHGATFWVVYLMVAVLLTVALMCTLILGISRSYATPRGPREPGEQSRRRATPVPRRWRPIGHAHPPV